MELTATEFKIADLVSRGYSEKEIAEQMFISPKTVHNHTYNIRKKWNARSAVDVARMFILTLDNPKQYFAALVALVINFHVMIDFNDIDLRKPSKTSRTARAGKSRKNEYQWN